MEQRFYFAGSEFLHGSERNAFQAEATNLVAAQALYIVSKLREKETYFPLLAVMHVHVEIRGVVARARIDERRSFDFQSFPFNHNPFDKERQSLGREWFLKYHVISFYHEI